MKYILVITAAALFSGQFIFQRRYGKTEGDGLRAALIFGLLTSLVRIPLCFAIYGMHYEFTPYGLGIAALSAAASIGTVCFSAKAFGCTNMALYSMFMMLGGMALPFAAGLFFFGEPLTPGKGIGCLLVIAAMLLGTSLKTGGGFAGLRYCLAVFVFNGMAGVLAKFNQHGGRGLDSGAYFLAGGVLSALICSAALFLRFRKEKLRFLVTPGAALSAAALFGICSGLGNLFLLIALETLPASVQYPLVTGGTIALSALFGLIRHEKLTARVLAAILLAAVSAVVVAL